MASIRPRISQTTGKITSYEIIVSDGYDSNGKKRTFKTSFKPPKDMTENKARKEAERVAVQFEDECKNGLVGSAANLRVEKFAEMYLDAMKDKLSPTVIRGYDSVVKELIVPALGHFKLAEIKPVHVQAFVDKLYKMPKRERDGSINQNGELLSPATVKRKLAVLQAMLTFAVKLGYITNNPADSKHLTLAKVQKPEIQIFTKSEITRILNLLEDEPLQFQMIIRLAIYTGCREGELVALKFSDINFETGKLTVARSAYVEKKEGEKGKGVKTKAIIKTKPTKSNKVRIVALNQSCLSLLQELKQQHFVDECRLGTKWGGDDWIFTQWDGTIMYPTTPSAQFSDFLERNGIKHRTFHSLRHTSATLLLYDGAKLKTVQERLGHADITTTNKYLHLVEQADVDAVNSLENLLEKKA